MQHDVRQQGATSQSLEVFFKDNTTFLGKTGLTFASAGISLSYYRSGAAAVAITPITLASLATAWASGGFKEIGGGWYRLDVPDAAFASGKDRMRLFGSVTGAEMEPLACALTAYDPALAGPTVAQVTADIDANSTRLATAAAAAISIQADTDDIQTRIPAALVGGRINASVGAMAADVVTAAAVADGAIDAGALATGAITAAKFAASAITSTVVADAAITNAKLANDAITASKLHADVTTELQAGLATAASLATSDGKLDTLVARDSVYVKNVAVTAFMFPMELTDGTPGTGLTVTGTVSKDGAAFNAIAGAITEVSGGWYKVNLSQSEMNADEVSLKFTAAGAKQRNIKIRTQS